MGSEGGVSHVGLQSHAHIFEYEKNRREIRGKGEVRINMGDKRPGGQAWWKGEVHVQGWERRWTPGLPGKGREPGGDVHCSCR